MLFCVLASTVQALWQSLVLLPAGAPLIHTHDLEAIADRRVDLHRVAIHYLPPFPVHLVFQTLQLMNGSC